MSLHISRKQNSFWKMPYQHCSSHLVFKVLRRCDYIVFGMKYSELDPKEPDILGSEMAFNKDNCSSAIQKLLWRRGTHSRALRIFSHAGIFAHLQPTLPASRSSVPDEGVSTPPFGAGFPQPLTLNMDRTHLSSSSPLSLQPPQHWQRRRRPPQPLQPSRDGDFWHAGL